MKQASAVIFFFLLLTATLPAAAKSHDAPSADELSVSVELSADTIFADASVTASFILQSPFEISDISPLGELSADGMKLVSESRPRFLGRQRSDDGSFKYVYLMAQYRLKPLKSGKHKISSPEFQITALTYRRVSDGFFVYNQPVEHQLKVKSARTTIVVLRENDPRIDTSRYPTSIACL